MSLKLKLYSALLVFLFVLTIQFQKQAFAQVGKVTRMTISDLSNKNLDDIARNVKTWVDNAPVGQYNRIIMFNNNKNIIQSFSKILPECTDAFVSVSKQNGTNSYLGYVILAADKTEYGAQKLINKINDEFGTFVQDLTIIKPISTEGYKVGFSFDDLDFFYNHPKLLKMFITKILLGESMKIQNLLILLNIVNFSFCHAQAFDPFNTTYLFSRAKNDQSKVIFHDKPFLSIKEHPYKQNFYKIKKCFSNKPADMMFELRSYIDFDNIKIPLQFLEKYSTAVCLEMSYNRTPFFSKRMLDSFIESFNDNQFQKTKFSWTVSVVTIPAPFIKGLAISLVADELMGPDLSINDIKFESHFQRKNLFQQEQEEDQKVYFFNEEQYAEFEAAVLYAFGETHFKNDVNYKTSMKLLERSEKDCHLYVGGNEVCIDGFFKPIGNGNIMTYGNIH